MVLWDLPTARPARPRSRSSTSTSRRRSESRVSSDALMAERELSELNNEESFSKGASARTWGADFVSATRSSRVVSPPSLS